MTSRSEFEAIIERGGVLGAMDTMGTPSAGRGKIQEESRHVEHEKHDANLLLLVGVNTFLRMPLIGEHAGDMVTEIELIRSTEAEKGQQIENVRNFQQLRNKITVALQATVRPERSEAKSKDSGLAYLQSTARERRNVFASLMEAVKTHSLEQISHALYEVGGDYRRNMYSSKADSARSRPRAPPRTSRVPPTSTR